MCCQKQGRPRIYRRHQGTQTIGGRGEAAGGRERGFGADMCSFQGIRSKGPRFAIHSWPGLQIDDRTETDVA